MTPPSPSSAAAIAEPLPVITERVEDAATRFPADGLAAGPADPQQELAELLPADDAFVLVVPAGPVPGQQLVCIVAAGFLKALGLSDADGLAGALAPVIAELAGPHEVHLDQARLGIGPIGLAGVPVPADGVGAVLVAAGLFLGVDHVATIGIGIPPEGAASADGAVPADPALPVPGAADEPSALDLPEVGAAAPVAPAAPSAPVASMAPDTARSLSLLRNVEMNVTAELGRARMTVADLLSLSTGSVVELDRVAGSPIDLLVNGTLIARGEVVVIDEEFGVRITEIVDRAEEL